MNIFRPISTIKNNNTYCEVRKINDFNLLSQQNEAKKFSSMKNMTYNLTNKNLINLKKQILSMMPIMFQKKKKKKIKIPRGFFIYI